MDIFNQIEVLRNKILHIRKELFDLPIDTEATSFILLNIELCSLWKEILMYLNNTFSPEDIEKEIRNIENKIKINKENRELLKKTDKTEPLNKTIKQDLIINARELIIYEEDLEMLKLACKPINVRNDFFDIIINSLNEKMKK